MPEDKKEVKQEQTIKSEAPAEPTSAGDLISQLLT